LVVRNGGALVHEFKMKGEEGSDGQEFELEGPELEPGGTVRLSATLRAGTYTILCSIDDHDELGMTTRLIVREDAPLVTPQSATAGTVEIRGFAYGPVTLTVAAGTEVTWRNADSADHTVTADGGAFGSDAIASGQTFATRLRDPGTYTYFCAIHPVMTGTVVVT
jgi:plastocyanin